MNAANAAAGLPVAGSSCVSNHIAAKASPSHPGICDSGIDFQAVSPSMTSETVLIPKGGLSSFNMIVAANMASGKAGGMAVNKNSTLKAAIVVGPEFCAVVFHCKPIDPNSRSGSWAEKTFLVLCVLVLLGHELSTLMTK